MFLRTCPALWSKRKEKDMKALVFHGIGNIKLEEVPLPKIKNDADVIVKITTSAICGTDFHFIRGTVGEMEKGTILGHEAVGVVEKVGKAVRNLKPGERVIVPSTVSCGSCILCRESNYSQCLEANPNGPEAGTAFFGGPKNSGPLQGCQAEYVRVPFGNSSLIKISDDVSDDNAILLSDIFPTAYFAADIAKVAPGKVVVVLGCGPVGQFVIASCKLMGASRIFAIDNIASRLNLARSQGAEVIDFNQEDSVEIIKDATKGLLADIVIDAVGVDAVKPSHGPAQKIADKNAKEYEEELKKIAPKSNPSGKNWLPGNAPSHALRLGVELTKKCGTISIVGVYPATADTYPIGKAMHKNIKIVLGNCPHKKYIPHLLLKIKSGMIQPNKILTQISPLEDIVEAYKHFDQREMGWIKVALKVI